MEGVDDKGDRLETGGIGLDVPLQRFGGRCNYACLGRREILLPLVFKQNCATEEKIIIAGMRSGQLQFLPTTELAEAQRDGLKCDSDGRAA